PRWAQKVFPDAATSEEATERLWEAIFKTTRIDQPDPEAAWKAHDQKLREKAAWLNNEQFDQLHYMAPGTDLVVGLPKNHIWEGAGAFNPRGEEF
ncbi:aminopeptidase, partial [Enterococcus faecium]